MTASAFAAVDETLDRYGGLTRNTINRYLLAGHPDDYLYGLVRDYPARGGKGIRPAILLATCQAFGGRIQEGLGTAAGLEMLHNAFLIHDDIEDDSFLRRQRLTLHAMYGVPLALNAGDALASLALEPVRSDPSLSRRVRQMLVDEFAAVVRTTTEGQALELGSRREGIMDLALMDYIALAGKKTCWYTTVAPLRMGAIIGTQGTAELDAISRFGFHLGLAFQTRDDLIDVEIGLEQGTAPLSDIREGKHTLLMIHLLLTAGERERAWLQEFLARPNDRSDAACRHVVELMHRYGSVAFTTEFCMEMADAARRAFWPAFAVTAESSHLEFLFDLIDFVVQRRM